MKVNIQPIDYGKKQANVVSFIWSINPVGSEEKELTAELIDSNGDCIDREVLTIDSGEYRESENKESFLLSKFGYTKIEVEI